MSDRKPASHLLAQDLDINLIDDSPFQRRHEYDPDKLRELANMILEHGQIDDALVRPKPDGRFELVAGHRRKRASLLIERTVLTCKVRDLTDDQARELVLIQQLQHEQWKPTEEAEGYAALLLLKDDKGKPKHTKESLALRIGKSEAHIRKLVAILDTPDEIRAAVDANALSKDAAAYVASVADPAQRKLAAQMVLNPEKKTSPLTAKETIELIQEKFQRRLQGAPFKRGDAKLLPEAGSCDLCQFRSGRMAIFMGKLQEGGTGSGSISGISPDICTKPSCYLLKCAAVEGKIKAEAQKRGCEIMSDDDAEKLFSMEGELLDNSGYVDRDAKPDPTLCLHFNEDKLPTWRKLLTVHGKPGSMPKAWLAKNPENGEFHELIKWEDAVKCINDGCRAGGEEPFFKAGEAEAAVEAAAVQPGESIFKVEPEKELWDPAEAKATAQEAKEKVKRDAARLTWIVEAMHQKLLVALSSPDDVIRAKIAMGYAEDMLTTICPEGVVDDLARFYGVQPETEETIMELVDKFGDMEQAERWTFLIMVFVRSMAKRFGVDTSAVSEWCTFLDIEEPAAPASVIVEDVPREGECPECANVITAPDDHDTGCSERRVTDGMAPPAEEVPAWFEEANAVIEGKPNADGVVVEAAPVAVVKVERAQRAKAGTKGKTKKAAKAPAPKAAKKKAAPKGKPKKPAKAPKVAAVKGASKKK